VQLKELFRRVKTGLFARNHQDPLSTSISDSLELGYLKSVRDAVASEESLVRFRADPDYQQVLEHVPITLGQKYLDVIISEYNSHPELVFAGLSKLSEFGRPPVHNFSGIGSVSPTILRYVKVAYELNKLFGDLSKLRIGEIGVGFGGQAAVLNKLFGVSDLVAFDLPEVLSLCEIFLSRTESHLAPRLVDGRKPVPVEVDLVVSNYAFSELVRSVQDAYLENVILRAKSGYITWNNLSSKNLDGYSLRELVRKIPGSKVLKEVPLESSKSNRLIIWGELL
jgi:putative sugar O-methyltransferase